MERFDEKLRFMAKNDRIQVPETLHRRMEAAMEPKKRFLGRRLVILAAAVCVLGTLAVGASYRITKEDLGYYQRAVPETTAEPSPVQLEESEEEIIRADTADEETAEALINGIESGNIHLTTEEEAQTEEAQYAYYTEKYADEVARKRAISAAEAAYYAQDLWDAEVVGARYEHIQEGRAYDCWETLVVLYLSDDCGYRMILNADSLELIQAIGLTPETMESEYFQALWDGTEDAYREKTAKGAEG